MTKFTLARQRFQEPDMCDRGRQIDMPHTVAPNFREGYFHAAFFTDDAAILHPLVFAAQTFVVFYRAKYTRAKQPIAFRLESPVIDRFRFLDLAERPRQNALW